MIKLITVFFIFACLQTSFASEAPPWTSVEWEGIRYNITLPQPIGRVQVSIREEVLGVQEIRVAYLNQEHLVPKEVLAGVIAIEKPEITIPSNNFIDQKLPLSSFTLSFEYGAPIVAVDEHACKVITRRFMSIEFSKEGFVRVEKL